MIKRALFTAGFVIVSLFCLASDVFAADGFAGAVTGGAGGPTVTANSAAAFRSYVESTLPYIVEVTGVIDLNSVGGDVNIRSNKTIKGTTPAATIIGQLGFVDYSSNVIIERLNITTPYGYGEGDGISMKSNITNVFVTKCTFYDCADGCLDITRASDYVTVSWCKFYYIEQSGHRNVNLVGADDGDVGDIGRLHVTFHHNWYSSLCTSRMPMVRYGRVHVYNNYYNCPGNNYCVRSRLQAECLIENNYFDGVGDPYYVEFSGKIKASGNAFFDCSGMIDPGIDDVFTPPYSYTLGDTLDVKIIVPLGAGADGIDFFPHWFFTFYGDFDRSGKVDANDLSQFVDYWLDTDDINNADYYEDGVVNGCDFALFAGNWLKETPPDIDAPDVPADLWALAGDATAGLDWQDNMEFDVNGYNVYRSTNSGGGYVKLNTSLVSSSDYTDDTVSNGTVYYYVVTAVDTSSNESFYSDEACAIPGSDGNNVTIQEFALGFCGLDGEIQNEYAGYTGWGYADTEDEYGRAAEWSTNILSAGTYTLTWRFANGSSDRPADLLINGSIAVPNVIFPDTGAWTNWSELSVEVSLIAGSKYIRLEAIDDYGLPNIDYLMVTGSDPEIAPCP